LLNKLYKMTNKTKKRNILIADLFLVFSQIAFFSAIIINFITDVFSGGLFIFISIFLIIVSIITLIIKQNL